MEHSEEIVGEMFSLPLYVKIVRKDNIDLRISRSIDILGINKLFSRSANPKQTKVELKNILFHIIAQNLHCIFT